MLVLPVVVGRALTTVNLAERDVRLILAAATVVALCMVAQLAGMLTGQLVASTVWPGGNWSIRLVVSLVLLAVPILVGLSALGRAYAALRAPRVA
jgi:hypothetical protein